MIPIRFQATGTLFQMNASIKTYVVEKDHQAGQLLVAQRLIIG